MSKKSRLAAVILSFVMAISMLSPLSYAKEAGVKEAGVKEDAASEIDFLDFKDEAEVKKNTKGGRLNTEYVKHGSYSVEFRLSELDGACVYSVPSDMSMYNELKLTLYATDAFSGYLHFVTDNSATDGSDYYGVKADFKQGWQEISFELAKIGYNRSPSWASISSFNISCTGWGLTKNPDVTFYLDSAILCKNPSYAELEVPEKPEVLPDGEAGIVRYYANDFESSDTAGANEKDNKITIAEKDSNKYMKMTKAGSKDMHFDVNLKKTTRYMVVSLDVATSKIPKGNTQLVTLRSDAHSFTGLTLKGTGEIVAGGQVVGKIKANSEWMNVAVACDFSNCVYSAYINGEQVAKDLVISETAFGQPWLYRIFLTAGEDNKANLMVDNLRIFDGLTPLDYENTYEPGQAAQKNFEKLIGSPSPAIDYSAKQLEKIDKLNGVMLNIHSGYIYANKIRSMPDVKAYIKNSRTLLPVRAVSESLGCTVGWDAASKTVTINDKAKITIGSDKMILPDGSEYTLDVPAEITSDRTFIPLRALCESILGKKVFWNDRGLIILTDEELDLSDKDIVALNNYMLYQRPSADEILSLFNQHNKNSHPRVIFDKEKLDKILSEIKTDELMGKWAKRVIDVAGQSLDKPHETYTLSNNQLLSKSRGVLEKALNVCMAYLITGDKKYADYIKAEVIGACNFPDWNHKNHYLDVGEMAMGVAVAYDWLYDVWSIEERKIMEEGIYKHAICTTQLPVYGQGDYGTLIHANTNWNLVCNGGVGVSAIALLDIYPQACADILEKHYVIVEKAMAEFYPDGAWYEGPGYWDYLMKYMAFFMTTTDSAFKTDFNITKAPGFSTTGEYIIASDGMTGTNNFHDAGTSHYVSDYVFWLSDILNKPELSSVNLYKMNKYNKPGGIYSLLYYDTSSRVAEDINLAPDTYFGGTEIVNLRSSVTDDGGIFASFHSGKNQVNHAHLDAGTFVIDIGGQRFAGDIGAENYNVDGYWGDKRYKYYRARPEGHNVFVINPDESFGQEPKGNAKIDRFETKPRGGFGITDISSSYAPYADSAKRGIMLSDERRSVTIRDEIRGMKKEVNQVYWFMQMERVNATIVDNSTVILEKNDVKVKLKVLSDAQNCEITLTEPVVLETSENLPNQTVNTGWQRLLIKFTSGKDVNINVKISVLDDPAGDTAIENISLENWSIPDGEALEFPKADMIYANGKEIKNFASDTTYYAHILPVSANTPDEITVTCSDKYTSEVIMPNAIPGSAQIKLASKENPNLQTTYTVYMRPAKEIEIEVSAEQEGNEGVKCLDKDLTTRWAVEGEAYATYTFAEPKQISAVWLAAWKSKERQLIFDIEVSTDGEKFTQVFKGKTTATEDVLTEYKIPGGIYKAVRLVLHGTTTSTWNSVLEVEFK